MTTNEICEYLGQVRGLKRRIERLDEQILSLRYSLLPGAIRYDKERVVTSPKDSVTETFALIDALERDRAKMIEQQNKIQIEIYRKIKQLPVGKERVFLVRYYIVCENMTNIADGLDITVRHLFRVRDNAIRMLAELQDEI